MSIAPKMVWTIRRPRSGLIILVIWEMRGLIIARGSDGADIVKLRKSGVVRRRGDVVDVVVRD
jgi:hypothetical protein